MLVTLDTTRADALGCYGAHGDPTPELDRLARLGTRFETAISTAALTPVAHASILTGLDNREHGLRVLTGRGGYALDAHVPTLATILHEHGYRTLAIQSAFTVSRYFGFERGFDVFDSLDGRFEKGTAGNLTWNQSELQRRSDDTTDRALAQLTGSEPFFLWVHYWDPHDEAKVPPPEYLPPELSRDRRGDPIPGRALYAAEIHYMDHEFGRLLSALQARPDWDRTLVVVVADHGEGLGDHGWQSHRILYQEQIHVPLIVRVPGEHAVPDVQALVRTTDIAPTVLDYLALDPPHPVSGRSLRKLVEGQADDPRVAFADAQNGYDLNVKSLAARPYEDFVYTAIDYPWKLIYRPLHPEHDELFDLARDPRELHDCSSSEKAHVLRLEHLLAKNAPWVSGPFAAIENSSVSEESAGKMLGDLGYVAGEWPGNDVRFAFACPDHRETLFDMPEHCPHCSAPPILVRRPH